MPEDVSDDPTFELTLETELLANLRTENVQAVNSRICLAERDADGRIIAGLSGSTSYGWLHIHMVWVSPDQRRCGRARTLVDAATAIATERGCHAAWLDTSSPAALLAWKRLGFVEFGKISNKTGQYPEQHARWFLQRQF